jgi:hypothetical protein
MAGNEELLSFVKEAMGRGLPRSQIEAALLKAGWGEDQVRNALDAFADIEFPIPVPRPRPYLSARDAFLYLVLFTTLYISAYNLGHLIFQFINHAFPSPTAPRALATYSRLAIRWSVSALIIAFPIFLYLSRVLHRAVARDPGKRGSKVRKWLTYVTLFIAACILIGDLTTLVYNVLGGELTLRFILKVLTVGAIAGTIFGYYLWDLRKDESETPT